MLLYRVDFFCTQRRRGTESRSFIAGGDNLKFVNLNEINFASTSSILLYLNQGYVMNGINDYVQDDISASAHLLVIVQD
jgi:hypothetical protein